MIVKHTSDEALLISKINLFATTHTWQITVVEGSQACNVILTRQQLEALKDHLILELMKLAEPTEEQE